MPTRRSTSASSPSIRTTRAPSRRSSAGRRTSACAGIKLGLNYQNVDPLGPEAFRIYDYAQAHRLPILFHAGTSPVRFADID